MKRFVLYILLSIVFIQGTIAQVGKILPEDDYILMVLEYHPLAKQAELITQRSGAAHLAAKGLLDIKLQSSFDTKQFKEQDYYGKWESVVKLPTALPIDFSVGYESNDGIFLNNEGTVPSNGLIYGSLNISLLRGLLFDETRFQLENANLIEIKNELEATILLNEIVLQAREAYNEWLLSYRKITLYTSMLNTFVERHQNIIQRFENGDIPAIDTLESRINLNTINKALIQLESEMNTKRMKVDLFIWDENGQPLMLHNTVIPEDITPSGTLDELFNLRDIEQLPNILMLDNDINQVDLKTKRLKEDFKPVLDIKFNALANLGDNNFDFTYNPNDYKFGAYFELPIQNRKTKSKIQFNDIKRSELSLKRDLKIRETQLKFQNLIDNFLLATAQFEIGNRNVTFSETLLSAEEEKFSIGESSVFLLNKRTESLLKAKIDLAKLKYEMKQIENHYNYLSFSNRQDHLN